MDEFNVYHQLCMLEEIAAQYTDGQKLCPIIRKQAELISGHIYRVAVIGEFKRGKSSLINALIGASVLPTDVIPLTAAITHVKYGTKQKIVVRYKDGTSEEKSLDELMDYATKYDHQREATAALVQEIEVLYPSVLCRHHIELFDTPGLNDNEAMSEVTLSILGEIDAAIVVISATKPLSLTEQNLIVDLIRQEGIRHLIFVVTFLDALADEEEQDRMLSFIRNRLKTEILSRVEGAAEADAIVIEKAKRILSHPDVFGVSSRQAIQGFLQDDRELLRESRFPQFKEELLALLTAAQSEDIPQKAAYMVGLLETSLPKWYQNEMSQLSEQAKAAEVRVNSIRFFLDNSEKELRNALNDMEDRLRKKGLSRQSGIESAALEKALVRLFIQHLSALKTNDISHERVYRALDAAKREATEQLKHLENHLKNWIMDEMRQVVLCYKGMQQMVELQIDMDAYLQKQPPSFIWVCNPIPDCPDLTRIDAIKSARSAVFQSIATYGKILNGFISGWCNSVILQNGEDRREIAARNPYQPTYESIKTKQSLLAFNYQNHMKKIEEIKTLTEVGSSDR